MVTTRRMKSTTRLDPAASTPSSSSSPTSDIGSHADGGNTSAPSLRKRNDLHVSRKLFHAMNGVGMVTLYQFIDRREAVALLLFSVSVGLCLEYARMNVKVVQDVVVYFAGSVMREVELKRLSGICFYLIGVMVCALAFSRHITILSVMYLAFGDPFASLVGILGPESCAISWNKKSLLGTGAMGLLCTVITVLYLHVVVIPGTGAGSDDGVDAAAHTPYTSDAVWMIAFVGGLSSALTELCIPGPVRPKYLDDNMTIPIVSGLALHIIASTLGVRL
eukprot:TRINITY_DN8858_c0_g1_i1.p1 TRINITY_DN8858_c0_g1~~TRINITY_DN8858_c0_g1_i1.p1  ORF type:complete len:286 (+),score=58.96 TRINITY_DN8858_c0_g1_i1:29-859(+)